jgi:transposase-like protein
MKKQYTPEFKAEVVKEFLRERKTLSQLAAEYGVHQTVIADWRDIVLKGLPGLFEKGRSDLEVERLSHDRQLGGLYAEIGRLATQVSWLKKESWHPR